MAGIFENGIGAIGSIASTIIGANAAKKQQEREQNWAAEQSQLNREFQTAEREASQNFSLDMWNRQNEYNTAEAQYERLLQTGMNPATALSMLGNGAAGTAASVQGSAPGSGAMPQAGSISGVLGQLYGSTANNALTAVGQGLINKSQQIENEYKPLEKQKNLDLIQNNINEGISRIGLNEGELKKLQYEVGELLPLYRDKTVVEISQINQAIKESLKKVDLMDKQIVSIEQDIAESESREDLNLAQKEFVEAQTATENEIRGSKVAFVDAQTAKEWASAGLIGAEKLTEDAMRDGKVELTKQEINEARVRAFQNAIDNSLKELQVAYGVNPNDPMTAQLVDKYTTMVKDAGAEGVSRIVSLFNKELAERISSTHRRVDRFNGLHQVATGQAGAGVR